MHTENDITGDEAPALNEFLKTDIFQSWLDGLKDAVAKSKIATRILLAERGYFGDSKSVGGGVFEMRVQAGPGYRIYFCREGRNIYWLLSGGDKSSQHHDIEKAKIIKRRMVRSL